MGGACHDAAVADERLLTISTYSRAVGIPASALRHYSAHGLLVPADVDPSTGYRYYAPDQIDDGVLVHRLRLAEAPLPAMREVLAAPGSERAALIDGLLSAHTSRSTHRLETLRGLRDELGGTPVATLRLRGTALSAALRQVLPAAASAEPDLAGVVWALGPTGLELSATDRYWLAHRHLPAAASLSSARLITTISAAEDLAERSARTGLLEVVITGRTLVVRREDGTTLLEAPSADRAVPDLARLVTSQPAARATVGLPRLELAAFTAGRRTVEADGAVTLRLELDGDGARLIPVEEPGDVLVGWASTSGAEAPSSVLLQARLLRAAAVCCAGEEVILDLVDGETPVRVHSPVQDAMTCLVMPMRP